MDALAIDHIRGLLAIEKARSVPSCKTRVFSLDAIPMAAMTREERRWKFNWFLFMVGYFTAGYLAINWVSSQRTAFFDVSLGFEQSIPFFPLFIFGYILVYLSVVLVYFVLDDIADWRRAIISFLLATTLAYIIFLIFPVRMDLRPDLSHLSGISAIVTRFYYVIDLPYNCFPSLHVTYPTLATLISWRHHRTWCLAFAAMTIVVAISVVLVKQHYLADVIAGFVNAGICYWLTVKIEAWKSAPSP